MVSLFPFKKFHFLYSPETVQNKPYSEKADIWSLGCIAFELMNLKAPFSGTNALILAKKVKLLSFNY